MLSLIHLVSEQQLRMHTLPPNCNIHSMWRDMVSISNCSCCYHTQFFIQIIMWYDLVCMATMSILDRSISKNCYEFLLPLLQLLLQHFHLSSPQSFSPLFIECDTVQSLCTVVNLVFCLSHVPKTTAHACLLNTIFGSNKFTIGICIALHCLGINVVCCRGQVIAGLYWME